jgi:hypothetical protein
LPFLYLVAVSSWRGETTKKVFLTQDTGIVSAVVQVHRRPLQRRWSLGSFERNPSVNWPALAVEWEDPWFFSAK